MAQAITQTKEALQKVLSNIEGQIASVKGMIGDIDERIKKNKTKGNVVDLEGLSPDEKGAIQAFIKEEIEEDQGALEELTTVKKLMPKMRDKV